MHHLVDGHGRPMVVLAGPGQAGDSPMLPNPLGGLKVARQGPGRPRTRPDALLADKAYTSKAHRDLLRSRGIKAVIPERADQEKNRKKRGADGGRPPAFDAAKYRDRNVVERSFNVQKQWRGLSQRTDKHVINYRGGLCLNSILTWMQALGALRLPLDPDTRPRMGDTP